MRVQLAPQAQELLGKSDLVMITERVADGALLIGQRIQRGLPEVLDRHIPRPWTQRGLSWGWTAVIWLAYLLTEGDHRQVSVATYLTGRHPTLSHLTAQVIEPLDVRDDRVSPLLTHVRKRTYGHQIAHDLQTRSIAVYAVSQEVSRCDATTVSGDHEVPADGLFQCGQSKEEPTRPQSTVMMGSLEPWGMPLSTDVVSGERADDGVYRPMIERIRAGLQTPGLVFVGDCTMSALDTRASLAQHQDWSWSPWPLTGATAEALDAGITTGVTQGQRGALPRRERPNDRGHTVLVAEGEEFARTCEAPGDGGDAVTWRERVWVMRSPRHADQQAAGLDKRRGHAEPQLRARTPPRGRGKRPITDAATLVAALEGVLPAHRVDGLRRVIWDQQVEPTTQDVGRGRGAVHRETRVLQPIRYPIIHIAPQDDTSAARRQRVGWKAFVTNAEHTRLSCQEAVLCSRHAYRSARICNRLKSRGHIAPLLVKRNEHIEGLTYLLTLGVRVVTVTEVGLRRALETAEVKRPGVHPENKQKQTDKPTAEWILKAFAAISLTIIKNAAGDDILRRLTPLSGIQEDILQRLGLGAMLYRQLEIQARGT